MYAMFNLKAYFGLSVPLQAPEWDEYKILLLEFNWMRLSFGETSGTRYVEEPWHKPAIQWKLGVKTKISLSERRLSGEKSTRGAIRPEGKRTEGLRLILFSNDWCNTATYQLMLWEGVNKINLVTTVFGGIFLEEKVKWSKGTIDRMVKWASPQQSCSNVRLSSSFWDTGLISGMLREKKHNLLSLFSFII